MARKASDKGAAKAPAKSAETAALAAAPAAAEQLATQPAAPIETAPPAGFRPAGGTEQPTESDPAQAGDIAGNGSGVSAGQEARPDTDPAAADAAAATSQPASAAPEASVGDAAAPGDDDDLDDDGEVEGLWITAIPEQGFRRCGYRFTREGFGIAMDALTAEQIELLENEPNLKVERGIFSGRVGERVE
nr:HI1506-related protein [Pseudomonas sp. A46]